MNLLKNLCLTTVMFIAVLFYGCDISDSNKSTVNEELTDEELEVAGQIIAESLSDQKDGIFASLNDAFSLPSSSNFTENSTEKGKYASAVFGAAMAKNSETNANNYSYSYDPDTGIHQVNFSRSINEQNFIKESTAELEYIYYDAEGNYIYSPRLDSDLIEIIEYNGFRSGSITTPNKNSSYERNDEFLIEGLSTGGPLTIEGLHEGSGQFEVTRENGNVIKRDYTLTVEFLDVQINSQTLSDGSLQKSVEGALAYEMMISKNLNGDESMKTVNGTIEFNGDGTALLRFQNILDDFKVTLEKGNLIADNEFEGYVESVDTESDPQQFTLSDGHTFLFGTDTEIDSEGDLLTLTDVKSILDAGIRVRAEGSFAENADGAKILQNLKFEFEDDDLEFESTVESADTEGGTFTLKNGDTYHITDETNFDEEGDLFSLEDLMWAIDNDYTVKAEGEFIPGEEGVKNVTEVKLEYDEADFEFDDDVLSADSEGGTFDLEDGNTYTIVEGSTVFDEDSDYSTLEEVATALSEGVDIEAEGDYAPQSDGSLLVTNVKFESDEADDDGDGDDEDREEKPFNGIVESADASEKTFSLTNGLLLHVNNDTEFDDDIQSLGNLVGALQRGDKVTVEGEYFKDSEDNNIAIEAEFDVERRNGDDDDEDEEDEEERDEFEFDGVVQSANAAAKTFRIDDLTFLVTNDTEFDGDLNSIGDLVGALQRGDEVEAEGEYYTDSDGRNIVTEVEFDVERRDEDGDDDDDGDDDGDTGSAEFEDQVTSVNISNRTFQLEDGRTFTLNDDTSIENDGDLFSLQDVADEISDGFTVTAEGDYQPDGDTNVVISVKFESNREDDDDSDDENEFGGRVKSVDTSSNSFTLMNDRVYVLSDDVDFDNDGDLFSLQEVSNDLADGFVVTTEGTYDPQEDGTRLVASVKFESNRDDDDDGNDDGDDDSDDDGDDEDDREEFDFDGSVTSATSNSFTLNSQTYFINDDSEIEGEDGITTLQDVIDALDNGDEVEAEGEYYIEEGDRIVVEVEFEVERNEDGDNDSDGDDDSDDNGDDNGNDDADGDDGNDDDGDDDDGNTGSAEFEDQVTSVNISNRTFQLEDGRTFTLNDDTSIENDGDLFSLQDVADELSDGFTVTAEGDYQPDGDTNVVISVKFESNREDDDNGDDNGNDDGDEDDKDEDDD
ncbi:MAG: DUF5666 domain-containing protein [Balneolaceae bacterium]|nr:DUF5666 domain-containing protein [Balneolaceae bacterium]